MRKLNLSLNGLKSNWEPVVTLISTHYAVKYSLLSDSVQITFCGPDLHKLQLTQHCRPILHIQNVGAVTKMLYINKISSVNHMEFLGEYAP